MVTRGRSAEHWREVARRAEGLGYDTLLMPDHITDQLAPMPALAAVQADANTTITVDVATRTVAAPGVKASFPLADYLQTQLVEGLDEIALTLRHEPDIAAFELERSEWLPRVR